MSIVVIVISGVLFAYWLRLVVRFVADARSVEQYANQMAATVRLNFPKVQSELISGPVTSLSMAYRDLDADYEILTGLLHTEETPTAIDRKLAMLGYRIASLRFRTCTAVGATKCSWCAKGAITEMSEMVQFLAGSLGAAYAGAAAGDRLGR